VIITWLLRPLMIIRWLHALIFKVIITPAGGQFVIMHSFTVVRIDTPQPSLGAL